MSSSAASRATIIGLDTPAGAYLARLLRARHYTVAGSSTDPDRAAAMLATLGADEVDLLASALASLEGPPHDEVYVLDGSVDASACTTPWPEVRVFVAAGPGGNGVTIAEPGRFVVSGRLYDHASRLDPPDHWALAAVLAVRDFARSGVLPNFDDPDSARDLGWTPEYVDAMWRMLQAPVPRDEVVATGVALSRRDIAVHAAAYFKVDLGDRLPAPRPADVELGDPSGIARDLGWRAFTHGRDLVRTLCEGVPA
ncbi:GDP-mannose 4,6-dehydratase [Sphingosinicellaceae bacterium]|nr:GDP-mannose 4,6-dehydratase [Sphingosinicellaceae bacterium]